MFLNQTIEYGLRAMAQLSIVPQGVYINSRALAESTGIPRHYILKVLRPLVKEGIVFAEKGHGGGFVLGRPPDKIRFADVLSALGHHAHEEHCLFGMPACDLESPCPLHEPWSEMHDIFQRWAEGTTFANLTPADPSVAFGPTA